MSYLYQEIKEQSDVLARLLEEEVDRIAEIAEAIRNQRLSYVLIAARGSSDNAATYGNYLLGMFNRLPVALATPSVFTLYKMPPRIADALVIAISQSGQATDIVQVVAEAKRQGALTLAITNAPDSPLAKTASHVILCHAGEERSIAATKTYTSQLLALALLSACLDQDGERLEEIRTLPEVVERTITLDEMAKQIAQRYHSMDAAILIGRGYNYATALEAALKLKELAYVLAQAYSSADFMHGPIALVENGFPVILFAAPGPTLKDIYGLSQRLKEERASLIVISTNAEVLGMTDTSLTIPIEVGEWLSPLVYVIPAQLFAYHLALAKGHDPDRPRRLKKITLTR